MGLFGPPDVEKLEAKRDFKGLAKAMLGDDAARRAQAGEAIGRLGSAEIVTPLVDQSDKAAGEPAIEDAVSALLAVGEPAANHLTVLLKSGSDEQRVPAAALLARMGDGYALGPLGELAESERFPDRMIAAMALGTEAGPSRVALLTKLSEDEEAPVRVSGVFSLGRIDDPSAREQLQRRAAEDPEEAVRTAAQRALDGD